MRKPVRYRLFYLCIAVATYLSGFLLLPQSIAHPLQPALSYIYLGGLLLVLPILFYLLVIVGGNQKLWRLFIPLSLGVVVARYTLPESLAAHFEFISYLRYPIIAIVLVIEFAVLFHVFSSLWTARNLKGDPRIHVLKDNATDEKKLSMTIMAASEPASYYYAIPYLSRHHPAAVAKLQLLSAARWHIVMVLVTLASVAIVSFYLIAPLSTIAAFIVVTVLCWGSVSLIASHRISRHYSVYSEHGQLILNATFFNMLCAPLKDIVSVESGEWSKAGLGDAVTIGRGKVSNLRLTFRRDINWLTMMAITVEPVHEIYLTVEDPDSARSALQSKVKGITSEA